jgi:hypothetical protein
VGDKRERANKGVVPKFAYDLGANLSSLAWYQLCKKVFRSRKPCQTALNPTNYVKTEG